MINFGKIGDPDVDREQLRIKMGRVLESDSSEVVTNYESKLDLAETDEKLRLLE